MKLWPLLVRAFWYIPLLSLKRCFVDEISDSLLFIAFGVFLIICAGWLESLFM